MDTYYVKIKELIERNLIEEEKYRIKVDVHRVETYYNVGKLLIEAQGGESKAKYGNELIKKYSIKLTEKFGKGYDYTNLFRMRQLYLTFGKVGTLSQQLSWSHYYVLLPIEKESKRNYYINETIGHNLSVRELRSYIKSNAYERLVNKDNIKLRYLEENKDEHQDILDMIKNPILVRINNKKKDKITEKALEECLVDNIKETLLELGIGFCFAGRQVPIKIYGKTYRPDLVFFNTKLNCFVIFEIKIKGLKISDIGQLEFYIKYYYRDIKKPIYNDTIGITISKKVDESITKYNPKKNIKNTTY
jgi:predicted nuclease of restriction endonuclease-like (RecB) superfamily